MRWSVLFSCTGFEKSIEANKYLFNGALNFLPHCFLYFFYWERYGLIYFIPESALNYFWQDFSFLIATYRCKNWKRGYDWMWYYSRYRGISYCDCWQVGIPVRVIKVGIIQDNVPFLATARISRWGSMYFENKQSKSGDFKVTHQAGPI